MKTKLVFVLILMVSLFAGCKPTEGELASIEKAIVFALKDPDVHLTQLLDVKKSGFNSDGTPNFSGTAIFSGVGDTIEVPFEYSQTPVDTPDWMKTANERPRERHQESVSFNREEVIAKVGPTEEQKREMEEKKRKQEEERKKQEEIAREQAKNAWKTEDRSIMADLQVRDAVKRRLKSPSTAKFPGIFDTEHWSASIGDSVEDQVYMVQSWVDSQNSFGGIVRTRYSALITQVEYDRWVINRLDFDE